MHPPTSMSRVVDGKRYSVKKAELIASDEYWDGSNFERSGRNTFLYRTPNGNYFTINLTQWQGERDSLTPISEDDARDLYEHSLYAHEVEYEDAFPNVTVEEA
jgi:hypothetical protein